MDSLLSLVSDSSTNSNITTGYDPQNSSDALVIETSLGTADSEAVDSSGLNFEDLYKGLSITGQKLIDKLNEILKGKLPDGIQSLKPEDTTSDATAEQIVQGATSFYSVYAEQHPELEGEELLNKFLDTIKSGIQKGYDDAYQTLKGLGAFEFDGVQASVEETKTLIDEKLKAFEQFKRQELGLSTGDVKADTVARTSTAVLAQAGGSTLRLAA